MLRLPAYSGFSIRGAFALADRVLAAPPANSRIQRIAGVGALVQRFVLPLDVCVSTNTIAQTIVHGNVHSAGRGIVSYKLGKLKRDAFMLMWVQNRGQRRREPLPGRPQVRCIRLSSSEPDRLSDWAKIPVDRLTSRGTNRLGFLRDDRPKDVQIEAWWEPAPQGMGCVLIEIWSGENVGAGATIGSRMGTADRPRARTRGNHASRRRSV
jgi:hypothetical protein